MAHSLMKTSIIIQRPLIVYVNLCRLCFMFEYSFMVYAAPFSCPNLHYKYDLLNSCLNQHFIIASVFQVWLRR